MWLLQSQNICVKMMSSPLTIVFPLLEASGNLALKVFYCKENAVFAAGTKFGLQLHSNFQDLFINGHVLMSQMYLYSLDTLWHNGWATAVSLRVTPFLFFTLCVDPICTSYNSLHAKTTENVIRGYTVRNSMCDQMVKNHKVTFERGGRASKAISIWRKGRRRGAPFRVWRWNHHPQPSSSLPYSLCSYHSFIPRRSCDAINLLFQEWLRCISSSINNKSFK